MYENIDIDIQFNNEPRVSNIYQSKKNIGLEYSKVNGEPLSGKRMVALVYFVLCVGLDSLLFLFGIFISYFFATELLEKEFAVGCMVIAGVSLICDIISIVGIVRIMKRKNKVFVSSLLMKAAIICLGCVAFGVVLFRDTYDFAIWMHRFVLFTFLFAIIAFIYSKYGKKNISNNENISPINGTIQKAKGAKLVGSEKLLREIQRRSYLGVIAGVLVISVSIFCILFLVVVPGDVSLLVLFLPFGVFGGVLLFYAMRRLKHPEKMSLFKNNPDVLLLLDELMENVIYEDDFIILSDRLIASKKRIMQNTPVAFTDEVFRLHIHEESTEFIPTTKELILITARGQIVINVYGRKTATINSLVERILQHCQYARFGCAKAELEYEEWMKQVWAKDKAYKDQLRFKN